MGIVIESDCQEAVNLNNEDTDEDNHPCCSLIEDCRSLRREMEPKVQHVLRQEKWNPRSNMYYAKPIGALIRWQRSEVNKARSWLKS
ncbi:hypothetical protein LguiB_011161 [Lonicera macranthoides]